MEKHLASVIYTPLNLLNVYFTTLSAMTFHPRKTLSNLSSPEDHRYAIPGFFLVANIFLSYLIGQVIGDEVPKSPIDIPILANLYGGYCSVIIRFSLGIFVFLTILRLFMKRKNSDAFISQAFPILCYSSIVYLPFVVLRHYIINKFGMDIWGYCTQALSAGVFPKFRPWLLLEPLFFLMMSLTLVIWWIWLMYTGIERSKLKPSKPKKVIVSAYVGYLLIKILLAIGITGIVSWPLLWGVKIISFQDIKAQLSKRPPDYLMAATLAARISSIKNMPPSLRYRYRLEEASYWLASPLAEGKTVLTSEILRRLENKDYGTVHSLLGYHIEELSSDRMNPKRIFYNQIAELVAEAESFRSSPGFIDPAKIIRLKLSFSSMGNIRGGTYYAIDRDQGGLTLHIMVVVEPHWISVFPPFT